MCALLQLEHLSFYLIELCLVEYEPIMVKPSLLCAAAIYVARCTLHITPAWTPLLCKHARYDLSQIRHCFFTNKLISLCHSCLVMNFNKLSFTFAETVQR